MGYKLGPASLGKLKGLHPNLVAVVTRAIEISEQDFAVICGVRTLSEQKELYAQGRTKPGNIVTWTLNSRHLPADDGLGRAVDLAPYPIDWNTVSKFDVIAAAMMKASKELGIPIRWGADWDQDGVARERGETDSPHWELSV